MHPLAKFSKMKKLIIDKIEGSPIYKHPSNDNKITGKTTLLNITTCSRHIDDIYEYTCIR